jgi:para-nitrobenzyl esterase
MPESTMQYNPRSVWFLAALLLLSPLAAAQPVKIESGLLEGIHENGLIIYMGVPYAAPPLHNLRWREPKRTAPWKEVRIVDSFQPACLQTGVSMPGETPPAISEDCLYLNIWAPDNKLEKPLPVIVWIHGGGYSNGSASMPLYWGDKLARRGIIVVTVAYRLGPLGFLAHPDLTHESSHHSSGNYGFLDQIAALEWVQRNIAAFGGDPTRVTIAGQSAGSMAVSVLIASPRAKGLFQRAIGESGGLFEPLQLAPNYLLANAEREGKKYLASLGVASVEAARKLAGTALLEGTAGSINHPVIEPYVLPTSPYDAFLSGRQNDVPTLIGSNAEEARALSNVTDVKAATFDQGVNDMFGALPAPILAAYPHATDSEARQARLDLERDLRFSWDMWTWARLQAGRGHGAVYFYSFKQQPPFPRGSPYEGWGASHFAELWYVFDHLDQARWDWKPEDKKLGIDMSSYWANFASSGDPNGSGLPLWQAFRGDNGSTQYLAEPISAGAVPNFEQLKVFDAVYTSLRGRPMTAR